ncbi:RING finger protein 17, partial [Ophiophagus hannah]
MEAPEQKLKELMCNIQDNVKGLGLLKPYNWKSGEACVVRAADTMWYRGEVKEVGAGIVKVHYVDYGYTEKIPPCHLYPTILYAEIAPFSIPCHLYKTVPEQSNPPWGKVCVKLWFSGMSLSYFMAFHKHCITEDDGDSISTWGLLKIELKTPLLPSYTSPSLPILGEHFPVKVTHVVSPNEILSSIPDMPCLAEYSDSLWYRAKLISILEFNPVSVLVEFVDYGSTKTLPASRLRQIPPKFMQYPAQAFRVLLAGFKPALNNSATQRIPYCPEWSLDALWAAMNCFEGNNLSASSVVVFIH